MAPDTRPTPTATDPVATGDHPQARRDAELAQLLAGAAAGRSSDFEAFYDRTVGYARALARRIVAAGDIDDALSEAYLEVWRHADRFDPARGSAITWLLTIVRSRAIDLRRRRPPVTVARDEEGVPASQDTEPADRLWQAESGHRLHAALADLSAPERWVLGLAYFRDLTHAAIAETTGMPLGTVKSLILRAHGKLRHQLRALS